MEQADCIRDVITRLETISLRYCITGSIASNYYGLPRLTHDLDIIVRLTTKEIEPLVKTFEKDFHIDKQSIVESLHDKIMFNVIHPAIGLKVDFWPLKDDEFNRDFFNHRRRGEIIPGLSAWLPSPEDLILAKLLWYHMTPSERQLTDIKGILEIQEGQLDLIYLRKWAKRLKVIDIIENVIKLQPPNRY